MKPAFVCVCVCIWWGVCFFLYWGGGFVCSGLLGGGGVWLWVLF